MNWIQRLFSRKRKNKPTRPSYRNSSSAPAYNPSDLTNPANPLSPFSPTYTMGMDTYSVPTTEGWDDPGPVIHGAPSPSYHSPAQDSSYHHSDSSSYDSGSYDSGSSDSSFSD